MIHRDPEAVRVAALAGLLIGAALCSPAVAQTARSPDVLPDMERAMDGRSQGVIESSLDADVLFDFDSAKLLNAGEQAVADLLLQLEEYDDVEGVTLVGHADRIGPATYDLALSLARAEAVAKYFEAAYPDIEVTALGAGEQLPQANPYDEDGRQLNRRVDVLVHTGQAKTPTRD